MSSSSPSPLDLQKLDLSRADPCVRLLNSTASVGCATPPSGVTVPLEQLLSADAVDKLRPASGEPRAVLLASELFTADTLSRLQVRMGADLSGVLVLHAESPPAGAASPDPAAAPEGHARNAGASGLSLERFQFAIVLLDPADSARVLSAISAASSHPSAQSVLRADVRPLVQLRYPMSARGNSIRCLTERSCLPLGGQSVWGALPLRLTPGAPVALLAAQIDGTAFFHETAPAADAAVSGTVALLAAVAAVAASPALRAQLPSLPATPAFALFTGEAWGALGSRRFVADIGGFNCTRRARAHAPTPPPPPPSEPGGVPPPPPPPSSPSPSPPPGCASPYKTDLRFEALRAPARGGGGGGGPPFGSAVRHVVQLGAVGATAARGELRVHIPAQPSPNSRAAAAALRAAATVPVHDARAGLGLPPGPAGAFVDAALVGGAQAAYTGAVVLADFDGRYVGTTTAGGGTAGGGTTTGVRGSRFDGRAGLDASLVCAAATTAARAWWRLAGGSGEEQLAANCSLVDELLDCLLPPPPRSSSSSSSSGDGEGRGGEDGGGGCALAEELGMPDALAALRTHYTGVFVSEPSRTIVSATSEFARRLLRQRLLAPLCADGGEAAAAAGEAGGAGGAGGACEPTVALHDAYSTGLEYVPRRGGWRVLDATQPLWTESNWPGGVTTALWPSGAASPRESALLLGLGAANALLTYAAVRAGRHAWNNAYKRL